MHKKEYKSTWKIENFLFCSYRRGKYLETTTFYPKNIGKLNFFLKLYPRGMNKSYSGFISFCAYVSTGDYTDSLYCEVKVIGSSGKLLKIHNWDDFAYPYTILKLKCPDLLAIKDVVQDAKGCVQDNLTILCNLYTKNHQNLSAEKLLITTIGVDRHTFEMQIERGKTAKHSVVVGSSGNYQFDFTVTEAFTNVQISISKDSSREKKTCFCDCTFILNKEYQEESCSERASHYFPKERSCWKFPSENLSREWENCVSDKYVLMSYIKLKLYCEFSCSNGTEFCYFTSGNDLNTTVHPSLQEDLLTLFHGKKLSDVKFQVGDETIEAHKNVLAARSPVFGVMFDQDMAESSRGVVDIVDIDANILKLFLEFIYTDKLEEMDYEVATSLLMVAEKYQVLSLKEICSTFLKKEMSVENVCEIYSMADAVNHESLKLTSIEFINANSAEIFFSSEWMTWKKNNRETADLILANFKFAPTPYI